MSPRIRKVILFILELARQEPHTFFWFTIRFLSAFLPLFTVYLFSQTIRLIETDASYREILTLILVILVIRVFDNYLRLKSLYKLEESISNIGFSIHNYFLKDLRADSRDQRHESVQAVRNFSDATCLTLKLIRQPGIDSFVSLLTIPVIFFVTDFQVFIMEIAYIGVYFFIDYYTTERYAHLKDIQNTKTEVYYAKLQDTHDVDLEQSTYSRHFARLSRWGFKEWFMLQGSAVIFYSFILFYLVVSVSVG
ncbi:MAG: hypothetical protein WCT01_04580, partial [Candidatus Shapirobacteria bacterium]